MRPITCSRAVDVDDALTSVAADSAGAFLAGSTNEVDLIRAGRWAPE
jgi:CO/xanthine dehydrogenase FAD-binding subunit